MIHWKAAAAARPTHAPVAFTAKSAKLACRPGTQSCNVSKMAAMMMPDQCDDAAVTGIAESED